MRGALGSRETSSSIHFSVSEWVRGERFWRTHLREVISLFISMRAMPPHLLSLLLLLAFFGDLCRGQHNTTIPCYDHTGRAQRCVPEFGNAAFSVLVEATNTCGMNGRTDYCIQTESSRKYCRSCYPPGSPEGESHPPEYLTDFNNDKNQTWWQSETMLEGIQYPTQVNLTLHLQKAYDITYVRLIFQSPRPESFVIYKRTTEDGPWIPYQYYSATCRDTYGLQQQTFARKGDETRAFCTSEYSDMAPLTGGSVPFSTLEGRPSAYNFDNSPELQEWVTATDIRITFDRLNTFGDELWREPVVLKSYFYAVMDLAVGARCKCNGHASECPLVGNGWQRRCRCEHNTAGPDCNECLPFYNDAPWSRATKTDAHECKACNCNGFSNRCYFDRDLYDQTGHGGHCIDCQANRAGPNCERCKENYYQQGTHCVACNCNEIGSRSKQCNSEGRCQCKPGVTGDKCDRCEANFYDFGPDGCSPCDCSVAGSLRNEPHCDPYSGVCICKENVEGRRCRECKPGFFNLDVENEYGCTPCFCYGQSSVCHSASGYSKVVIESMFARSNEKWAAEDYSRRPVQISYNGQTQTIGVHSLGREPVYFLAPNRFLGDQRASYNQDLEFRMRVGEAGAAPTADDIILEGAGLTITQPIFGQNNPLPDVHPQDYKFRLHEHSDHGWQPRLSSRDFMSVLANLTAIKIRGTYVPEGYGFLDDVKLKTARRGAAGQAANWIEMCKCPQGYVGQFCESCAHKYRHDPPNGGPFARCVPCNCNGHAESCEEDTGRCICQHNTEGENCEMCARGFYGNSLEGTPNDCKPCPCPDRGACIQLGTEDDDDNVVCLECPVGYGGPRCDLCSDGYFGDPSGRYGSSRLCQPCDCNTNVDPNAVGNCNRTTGECLKCIYNTGGSQCDQCLPGFYGDALAIPKGDCKPCQCYRSGTMETENGPPLCDQLTGQCHCKPHVQGTNCDTCEDGYFNIVSGEGCEACNCDIVGSLNRTCDAYTGQCHCRPGVTGKRCDQCEPYHYGFSIDGCKPCNCDEIGSSSLQCDPDGQCPCLENVEGRQCDRCKENKYDRQRGCLDCEPCYNLVQDAANEHRSKLKEMEKVLKGIADSPTVIDDADFEKKLKEVQMRIEVLSNDAKYGARGETELPMHLSDVSNRLQTIQQMIDELENYGKKANMSIEHGQSNVTLAIDSVQRAREQLDHASEYLQTDGTVALQKAMVKSDEFGDQNKQMAAISQEARNIAQEHEKQVDRLRQIAEKSLNISTEAYEISKDAVKKQRNTTEELDMLNQEMSRIENKVDAVMSTAEEAQEMANKAQEEALGVYEEIYNLQLPDVTSDKLKNQSEFFTNSAKMIKMEAEELLMSHADSWKEVADEISVSEDLLERGEDQQNLANELLANVDLSRTKAKEAVKLGEKTIQEAQETYEILSDFERKVEESKDKARESLNMVPEIMNVINQAKERTEEAERALKGAEIDAEIARETAMEAQMKYAEEASKQAHEIKTEAEETKKSAGKLRDEADSLSGRVAITVNTMKKLEDQVGLDSALTSEAKKKVGQTKLSVNEASKQVQNAMTDVEAILKELEGLSALDENDLNDLEARLVEAEEIIKVANLDDRLNVLREEKMSQTQLINNYQTEVDKLREEVANIEKIAQSLPDGCFKREQNLEL